VVIVLPRPGGVCLRARLSSNVRHTTGTAVPHHRRARPWAAQHKAEGNARSCRLRSGVVASWAWRQALEGTLSAPLRSLRSIEPPRPPQTLGPRLHGSRSTVARHCCEGAFGAKDSRFVARPAHRHRRLVSSVVPNQSLKPTRYGMRCKPGPRQSYYRRSPGLHRTPPRAA
jgi:hypothetical protein